MSEWIGGQFDPGQFDPAQFDTGVLIEDAVLPGGGAGTGEYDPWGQYARRKKAELLREDEEIVEIISIIAASGILDK